MSAPPDQSAGGGHITLRYWAAARSAAGVESDSLPVSGTITLAQVYAAARALHDDVRFSRVLGSCSVVVGDRPVASNDPALVRVEPGSSVEFLPPFAGG